jgi:hypothetical protein
MSDFGSYTGREFLGLELKKRDFLVDKLAREKDSILMVGGEKAGKSLIIKQLICSLTSGEHPFLNLYDVKRPCKVTYIQVEGELSDTQDRFKRMIKTLDFNPDNFQIIFAPPLGLQEDANCVTLMQQIESVHVPDVLIIDPLYFAFEGSLSDDGIVRKFLGNIRKIKDKFGCAVIIVHHTHRIKFNAEGGLIDEGDDALFGSSAFKWWPDHIIFFTYNKKKNTRDFRCSTQRSGDILKKLELILVQPDPLYFRHADTADLGVGLKICQLLAEPGNESGLCPNEICKTLDISRATFYRDITAPLSSGAIEKDDSHRPVKYKIKLKNGDS